MFKCPQNLNSCDLSDFLRFSVRKIKFGFKSAKNTKNVGNSSGKIGFVHFEVWSTK